ncbi:hypothetical protein AALA24_13645 [Anaerovoracaceae bacterium 42-11]
MNYIKTDDMQYCKKLKDGRYHLIEVRCPEGFALVEGIIDILDYDPAKIIPPYYGSVENFIKWNPNNEVRKQLFAEMCFESLSMSELSIRGIYETENAAAAALEKEFREARLFVDMDGTLTTFTPATMGQLNKKGYFANLKPLSNVVDAVRLLIDDGIDVYILSAVLDNPYAPDEKRQWINSHIPEIEDRHIIFVPCGADKSEYVPENIQMQDILLDDYSRNLHRWKGCGIKLRNGINGTHGTWKGASVDYSMPPEELAEKIKEAISAQVKIK